VARGASGNISVGNGDTYHGQKNWTGSIVNNISVDSPYGINVYGDIAAGQRMEANLVYNNQTNLNLKGQTCTGCVTNEKPLFVGTDDFHLKAGSPGIDDATTTNQPAGLPTTDMDGTPRSQGGKGDLGAYEFKTGEVIPPNPTPSAGGNSTISVTATSCDGLPAGALYNSGGNVKVCP